MTLLPQRLGKGAPEETGGLWRERKKGETKGATVKIPPCQNSNIFSTGLTETRVFLGIKKKSGHHHWIQIPNRWLTGLIHVLKRKIRKEKHKCTFMKFIHWFSHFFHALIHSFIHSNNSHPPSYAQLCLTSYFYHLLCRPNAEKADFFPQKLDSSCLTRPSPSILLPPFPSFCLSAVKGNNQAPIIDHTSTSAAERQRELVKKNNNKIKKKRTES